MSGYSFGDDDNSNDNSFAEDSFSEEKNSNINIIASQQPVGRGSEHSCSLGNDSRTIKTLREIKQNKILQEKGITRGKQPPAWRGSEHSYSSWSASRATIIPGEIKQNRLLRERRILREKKRSEEKDLYYHFIGTILNVSLATLAMIFIIAIASTGGLCFEGDNVKIFSMDQLNKCSRCDYRRDPDYRYWVEDGSRCEYCEGTHRQCYYPYY